MNKRITKNKEYGITLVALVVTIIVLLILAAVTISLALANNGLIARARDSSTTWNFALQNETKMFENIETQIDDITATVTPISQAEIELIEQKISDNSLVEVSYKPQTSSSSVSISSAYNGGASDQHFTQSNLQVLNLKWYVLSADENGVNLVSQPTSAYKLIKFRDAGGYDNCLYYLKEMATKFFINEDVGVTSDRVHILNLSDIKKATEQMNGSSYNWENTFIGGASNASSNFNTEVTVNNHKKYPQIYGTSTGDVAPNNPLYDEKVEEGYSPISGDLIASTSPTASTLKFNHTLFYYSNSATCKEKLGTFGSSAIGSELFNTASSKYIWLATRAVNPGNNSAGYTLQTIYAGYLSFINLAYSNDDAYDSSYYIRAVVSIPKSKIEISSDGTVTLK